MAYTNDTKPVPGTTTYLLMEDGGYLLQEDGSKIILTLGTGQYTNDNKPS